MREQMQIDVMDCYAVVPKKQSIVVGTEHTGLAHANYLHEYPSHHHGDYLTDEYLNLLHENQVQYSTGPLIRD